MYFYCDSDQTISWLSDVLTTCKTLGRTIRFDVDAEGNLRVKAGEGIWSAPIASSPDPFRD
jgi:hypothetical protein